MRLSHSSPWQDTPGDAPHPFSAQSGLTHCCPLPSLVGVPLTSPWALPSSCCPWCLPSSHLDLNMPVPPTPPTHEGPCLFSSEAANPQLSFSPFCSGPGHWSLVTSAYEWPQPPTPRSSSVHPAWPSQVSVTAGTVLPALLLASFPGGYIHRVPLSRYMG